VSKVLLEVCCGSLDDAIEAELGGADRVELCSCLFFGGLTPSIGSVIEAKRRLKIPVIVMIRPRGGGFCYTEPEFAAMQRDAEATLAKGADGIVFGILNSDGTVDFDRNRRLCELAGGRESVFHRAIDVTPDPFSALDQLIELGFTRVLTSGQQPSVPEGLVLIQRLTERAAGRITVMPGGGIRPNAVQEVIARLVGRTTSPGDVRGRTLSAGKPLRNRRPRCDCTNCGNDQTGMRKAQPRGWAFPRR
jgi:copper homeostasis protein